MRSVAGARSRSNRPMVGALALILTAALVAAPAWSAGQEKKDDTFTMKKGAGIGALLGLALGSGNIIEDTVRGVALGAVGGAVVGEVQKSNRKKDEQQQVAADREANVAAKDAQIDALEGKLLASVESAQETEAAIVQAIGGDNWEGYKALRACHHKRAYALAGAGATAANVDHQRASVWLEAMTAVDQKDNKKAEGFYKSLVASDPDIDTVQQASLVTDQAVLDMRAERGEIGIGSCR
jgi:hypothetical protein